MKPKLTLDPVIEKQLQSYETELSARIQDYLDHPEKLPVFMDFRVDYAFKYILGHKPVLLKLLNDVLPVEVADIEYLPNEIPVVSPKEKRAAFDVICKERRTGERFITEMQCLPDTDMDDRLLFYGASLIHSQVERGSKTYTLKPVYVLCVADYERPHAVSVGTDQFFFHYRLREATHPDDCFSRNLQFFFLELPRLGKIWDSLETNLERWCYLFGNLNNFAQKPTDPAGFDDVFNLARTGTLRAKNARMFPKAGSTKRNMKRLYRFHIGLALLLLPLPGQAQERTFPLPVDESRSMLSRWAQKEVQASLLIDDMEQEGLWTVREGTPQLSYTRENRKDGIQALRQRVCLVDKETLQALRTPWNTFGGLQGGATCVALEFEQPQDWSAYNRISLWVYIHPSRNPNVSFALDLITDTPDGSYTPSRETNVDIPQGKWVQVLWEIDAIKRDKVLRFELCQTCTGYDRALGEPVVTLDLDRLELQRVEPDHYEGWDLPAGHFAFAHTGYLPEASKVALAGPGSARRFSVEDRKGKIVFRGRARELAHKGNRFMELDFSRLRKEGRYRIRYGDALSEEFPIGPDVWEEPLWNVLNFYYCQRCGYPVEGIHGVCHADVQAFQDGEYKVVNGGWHDAGDLSQGFWRTAYGCYALLEALDVVPPSLRGRMADEARWGLRWLLKARFPEGRHLSWNTVRYYSDNVPGTLDDVASPATFIPWETLQGVAVFARAWETPDFPADEKANFAKAAKEDWEAVMKALEWEQASTLEAAWGAVASALLYRHFQDGKYKEAALHFGERLLGCSFVTADTHAAFNEAPMLALSTLSEVFPEASAPWKEAARRHVNDFLKPGSRLSAPYYLLPAGEYPGKGVCTFPVWTDHVFHGATNIHLSQAWALAAAAALTEDREAMELVQTQLEWTLGRNPFSSSLMYGVGYNFAPNFVYCTRHIAGALPVGVDSFHDDSPFWNGTAHATAHEIWIEPVSRFLGTLAVYLKRF